jgi:TusA-related sulfurtransferase
MATKKAVIRYSVRPLDRGGQLTIHTTDPDAVRAVHEFLAFQRAEHHAPH